MYKLEKLQVKAIHEVTSKKRKAERKEIGSQKIFYAILKQVIKSKKYNKVTILLTMFGDSFRFDDNFLGVDLLSSNLQIDDKTIFLGRTCFDYNKLQTYLKAFGFKTKISLRKYDDDDYRTFSEKIFFNQYYQLGTIEIECARSNVLQQLLNFNPQNEILPSSLNNDGSTLIKK